MSSDGPSTTKGIEDVPESVIKCGIVTAGFCPIKNKQKYFAVLCERALELHDKEKDFRKKKNARFFIDLSRTLNVHDDHMDVKLKRCLCWMGAGETFCLKAETDAETTIWFEKIFQAAKVSRMLTLCRPVTVDEFFSFAWDVEVVTSPKFKKPFLEKTKLRSVTETGHMKPGLKRLCFYPRTMIFCDRNVEPSGTNCNTSNVPPLNRNDYQEVSRTLCSDFGVHEKVFIVKLGTAAPPGSCTIWVQCENEEISMHIYRKLNQLIDQEATKKKHLTNLSDVSNALSSIAAYSRTSHRDRSHTQPNQMRQHLQGHPEEEPIQPTEMPSPIVVPVPPRNNILQYAPRDRRNILMERKGTVASFEEDGTRLQTPQLAACVLRPRGSLGNPTAIELLGRKLCSPSTSTTHIVRKASGASLSARCNTIGSPAKNVSNNASPAWSVFPQPRRPSNTSQSIVEEPSDYQAMFTPPPKKVDKPPSPPPLPKQLTDEDNNEDSGGTLRLENDEVTTERRPTVSMADKIFLDRKLRDSDTDDRSSVGGISGGSIPSSISADAADDYVAMDNGKWPESGGNLKVNVIQFDRLDDNKYVSDSSDSCYSSMAANSSMSTSMTGNTPRAYSFGGRPQLKQVVTTINEHGLYPVENVSTLVPPLEDPRKRSYSLGSKNFITKPLQHLARKFASSSGRHQRQSQTSASGVSLASSGGSSFGPSSASSNHLASSAENDETRNRSGSFGSGRSTPYTRRLVDEADHLVEMDFPVQSCSSSMASIDSPSSRSRTSSFGYTTKDQFFMGPSLVRLEDLQKRFTEDVRETRIEEPEKENQSSGYASENLGPGGFQAIEESDSESSRRGSRLSLNTAGESSKTATPMKNSGYDDEYALMEAPGGSNPSTSKIVSPVVIKRNSSKHRNSPSTLRTPQPPPQSQQASPQPDTRPDRSASSPVRDVLVPPTAGLPKRCSVPSMRSDSKDDTGLNYASLQVNDDVITGACSVPKDSFLSSLPASVNRTRSQSGIIFPPLEKEPESVNPMKPVKS